MTLVILACMQMSAVASVHRGRVPLSSLISLRGGIRADLEESVPAGPGLQQAPEPEPHVMTTTEATEAADAREEELTQVETSSLRLSQIERVSPAWIELGRLSLALTGARLRFAERTGVQPHV